MYGTVAYDSKYGTNPSDVSIADRSPLRGAQDSCAVNLSLVPRNRLDREIKVACERREGEMKWIIIFRMVAR